MNLAENGNRFSTFKRTACIASAACASAQMMGWAFGLRGGWSLFLTVVATFALTVIVQKTIRRFEDKMSQRIKAVDPVAWQVIVNGVKVGEIDDATLASFRLRASQSGDNAVAALRSFVALMVSFVGKLLQSVPVAMFWIVLACFFLDSESLFRLIEIARVAPPAELAGVIANATGALALLAFMVHLVIEGVELGRRNEYRNDVDRMIRMHCNIAADGQVLLMRNASSEPGYPKSAG